MHDENNEEGESCMHCCNMAGPVKKDFKLAMLEKKEKMMQAKLEFIGKMKEMVKKMPTDKE